MSGQKDEKPEPKPRQDLLGSSTGMLALSSLLLKGKIQATFGKGKKESGQPPCPEERASTAQNGKENAKRDA